MKLIPKFQNGYKINPAYKHYRDYIGKDEWNKLPDSEKDEYVNKLIENFFNNYGGRPNNASEQNSDNLDRLNAKLQETPDEFINRENEIGETNNLNRFNNFDIKKNFAELQERIKKLKMNPSLTNTEYTDKYQQAGLTNDDSLKNKYSLENYQYEQNNSNY